MSDNVPPRKKRFLSSARRTFTALLRRRGSSPKSKDEDDDEDIDSDSGGSSDGERDTPILSQVQTSNTYRDINMAGEDSCKKLRRQGIVVPYQLVSQGLSKLGPLDRDNILHRDTSSQQNSVAAADRASLPDDQDAGSSKSNTNRNFTSNSRVPLLTDHESQKDDKIHPRREGELRQTDVGGMLLRPPWASSLPRHAARQPSNGQQSETTQNSNQKVQSTASNARTRLSSASDADPLAGMSSLSLKRKRAVKTTMATSSCFHQHTGRRDFNVFTDGILLHPELVLEFAQHLPIKTLISLYSISKGFHTIVDQRMISVVLGQGLRKCEIGIRVWPWNCYNHLCMDDPREPSATSKQDSDSQGSPAVGKPPKKRVPTLRYLSFIMHRSKVLQELFAIFAEQGVPLPEQCRLPMAKMWFMFDIPDRARRIGYAHSKALVSDEDLYLMMTFVVRLDMLLLDPVASEKKDALRKMLFSDWRGFDGMLHLLKRSGRKIRGPISTQGRDHTDFLRMWVRMRSFEESNVWTGINAMVKREVKKIFDVPIEEMGAMSKEFWGLPNPTGERPAQYLMRPDSLVQYELVHRGLKYSRHLLESLFYGYVGSDGTSAKKPKHVPRRIAELRDEEYGLDDEIGGLQALSMEDGGDPLLDIGPTAHAGLSGSRRSPPSKVAVRAMQKQKEMTAGLKAAWKAEVGRA